MSAINLFGVTTATLESEVFGLDLTNSDPDATAATRVIKRNAGHVNALMTGWGMSPDGVTDADTEHYNIGQELTTWLSLGELLAGRDGQWTDSAQMYRKMASDRIKEIDTDRKKLGEGKPNNATSPGTFRSHVTRKTQIDAAVGDLNRPARFRARGVM